MKRSLLAATGLAGVIAAGAFAVSFATSASAAPLTVTLSEPKASLIEKVDWRCDRVRHWCAARWSWGDWRWRRCVRDRGCRL